MLTWASVRALADLGDEPADDQADRDAARGAEHEVEPASASEKLPPTTAATATR